MYLLMNAGGKSWPMHYYFSLLPPILQAVLTLLQDPFRVAVVKGVHGT